MAKGATIDIAIARGSPVRFAGPLIFAVPHWGDAQQYDQASA